MSKIRIKNFGPIIEGYLADHGWLDIKKVTLFIGEQGSGKSTVAKLIATFVWVEKSLFREYLTESSITNDYMRDKLKYHRLVYYFNENSEIGYIGTVYSFSYKNGDWVVSKNNNSALYKLPKIMYVPSERNFLSCVEEIDNIPGLPFPLYTFLDELKKSQKEFWYSNSGLLFDEMLHFNKINAKKLKLPIGNIVFEYNIEFNIAYIVDDNYRIPLSESSSGMQSFVPLYLVSRYLALSIQKEKDTSRNSLAHSQSIRLQNEVQKVLLNENLSEDLKHAALAIISSKYINNCFINIVEEPEQNLFPTSQRAILNCLLEFCNLNEGNKLIMTTHSPYIINYIALAVKAFNINKKIETVDKQELRIKLNNIVPLMATISMEDLCIYELDEKGNIIKLSTENGLPSDENYLNEKMAETNELYAQLLEIQQEI